MRIIVDADACPRSVLKICLGLGRKYDVPVWTVASFNHHIESTQHIVVGNAPQEADLKVLNLIQPGEIAISQDWGLAAMVIAKGAHCLSPAGREFRHESMDFLLEEREIKAKLRRSGVRSKGPRKRNRADDLRFQASLEKLLLHIQSLHSGEGSNAE